MADIRTILFIGESHVHAVQAALKQTGFVLSDTDLQAHRLTKIKNGKLIGTLNLQDLLLLCETLTEQDLVVSLIGGNQHSSFSLIQHEQPFRIAHADGYLPDGELPILPRATVRAHFERGLRGNDAKRVKQIAASGCHRTVHLSPPPPKEDEAHIMKRFETDFARKGLAEKGLSPAQLRQQIWELQNEVMGDILAEDGITLLSPPSGTVTEDGFLHSNYYANDATHANVAYGEKVLEQITEFLQAPQAQEDMQ